MSPVQWTHGPSSSAIHDARATMPKGGDLFSDGLCGLGLPTTGPNAGGRHHHCSTEGSWWQNASIASQLLGLVAHTETPEDKSALISAAISLLKNARHGRHHGSDRLLETLGRLAQQISTSSGLSKSAKDRILDAIAGLVKQIASSAHRQHGTSTNILNSLNQLISRISRATGLDQAAKNSILDELARIVQQVTQSGSPSSGCLHAHASTCRQ